jgi:hypothetical protein
VRAVRHYPQTASACACAGPVATRLIVQPAWRQRIRIVSAVASRSGQMSASCVGAHVAAGVDRDAEGQCHRQVLEKETRNSNATLISASARSTQSCRRKATSPVVDQVRKTESDRLV